MINDLLKMVEKELGTPLPDGCAQRLHSGLCQAYGGERVYVPKLPKLVHQVRLVELGTAVSIKERAVKMEITTRRVRQLLRGR